MSSQKFRLLRKTINKFWSEEKLDKTKVESISQKIRAKTISILLIHIMVLKAKVVKNWNVNEDKSLFYIYIVKTVQKN